MAAMMSESQTTCAVLVCMQQGWRTPVYAEAARSARASASGCPVGCPRVSAARAVMRRRAPRVGVSCVPRASPSRLAVPARMLTSRRGPTSSGPLWVGLAVASD